MDLPVYNNDEEVCFILGHAANIGLGRHDQCEDESGLIILVGCVVDRPWENAKCSVD